MAVQTVIVPSVWPPTTNVTITGPGTITGQVLTGYTPPLSQFGTVTPRLVQRVAVGSVGSAQQFGTVRFVVTAPAGGVPSAQQFGVPKTAIRFNVGGVSSAQAFGAVGISARITVLLGGVSTAQSFGAL